MANFRIGDRVRDKNPNWPNYNCTGVVTSVNGNNITWKDNKTGKLISDIDSDLEIVMRKGGRKKPRRKKLPRNQSKKSPVKQRASLIKNETRLRKTKLKISQNIVKQKKHQQLD